MILIQRTEHYNGLLIDSHVHIFPEKMMQAVFSFFQKNYRWDLPFPTEPQALLNILSTQGVSKAFALAYTHKPGLAKGLNNWLAGFCRNNPLLVPFGAVHPDDEDFANIVNICFDEHRFPGMKLHCLVQRCRPNDEKLFPLYEIASEKSKGMIIHAGNYPQPDREHLGVDKIAALLKRFPRLNLIVPHLGLNDVTAYRELLDTYEGLYLDTAFVFQNGGFIPPLEEIMEMLTAYPERFIYGSDFPLILEPPQNGIARILGLGLPRENYEKLFFGNASAFLQRIAA